jgi:hypothetical protein
MPLACHQTKKICLWIVSKTISETTMCPKTFIVKILIIGNMRSHHIYMKWKEVASVKDSCETEREIAAIRGNVSCTNGRWKNRPVWDKPAIK